ncbi:hypothetical protein DFH28DRAFT_71187 [Melampsora americana]|nr:hypothetical protein DFH28DRAFT_71187 [Melampsora americana]
MQIDQNRTLRKRAHSTRCTIPDRLSYLCRRRSNESFTCAGSFSPDLVSPNRLSYDDLLEKSQTQKYHYQKHLDTLAQKAQPLQSTPQRCSFLLYLRTDKGDRENLSMQTVDMVYNVRWLRLISEVEKAVNTRPFRPIRTPLKPDWTQACRHEKRSTTLDSYIPFPIPPTQSFPIKDRTSTGAQGIKAAGNLQCDELQGYCGSLPSKDHDAKKGRTDLFESVFNFRLSQELQMERWDHLVQLERRAREASEEGLRKASLGSTTSLTSHVPLFPPRKLSAGILNRMRRPSTATKDSKSSLSISNPMVISPLESSFLLGTNFASDFEFRRPDPYRIQEFKSFSNPDLSSQPSLEIPNLTLGRLEQDNDAQAGDSGQAESQVSKQRDFSLDPPFSRRDLPRPKGPRPPRLPIHGSNSSPSDIALAPRLSSSKHESTHKPTSSDLTPQDIVCPEVPPLRITKRSLKVHNQIPSTENSKLITKAPVIFRSKITGNESPSRYNHHWDTKMDVERGLSTSNLNKLISKDDINSQLRSGTTSFRGSGACHSESRVDLGSKPSFEATAKLDPRDPPFSMQPAAERDRLSGSNSASQGLNEFSSNHSGDQNQNKRTTEVIEFQKLPDFDFTDRRSHLILRDEGHPSYVLKRTSKAIKDESLGLNQHFTNQESHISNMNGSKYKYTIDSQRRSFPDRSKPDRHVTTHKTPRSHQVSARYTVPLKTKNEEKKSFNQVPSQMIHLNQYHRSMKDLGSKRVFYKRTPLNPSISNPIQSLEKSSESLIFELPIIPQKNLTNRIHDQKVKQAWESLSHYKKWTGMNRPNIQGVIRIQGGRLRDDHPIVTM